MFAKIEDSIKMHQSASIVWQSCKNIAKDLAKKALTKSDIEFCEMIQRSEKLKTVQVTFQFLSGAEVFKSCRYRKMLEN